jgi:hypothetical protein
MSRAQPQRPHRRHYRKGRSDHPRIELDREETRLLDLATALHERRTWEETDE